MKFQNSGCGWFFAFVMLALTLLAGCNEATDTGGNEPTGNAPQAAAAVEPSSGLPARNAGKVISNQLAGGYSYLEIDVDGDRFWLATSISSARQGDSVAWKDHAVMTNFRSKSLNRDFERILFVDHVVSEAEMAQNTHRGKVLESLSSAGYSYIRVEENGASLWLAAPETKVEAGQSILWSGGSPMRNFTSRSLEREFDEITFVNAIQGS
jgi:hypothetical protein